MWWSLTGVYRGVHLENDEESLLQAGHFWSLGHLVRNRDQHDGLPRVPLETDESFPMDELGHLLFLWTKWSR